MHGTTDQFHIPLANRKVYESYSGDGSTKKNWVFQLILVFKLSKHVIRRAVTLNERFTFDGY